MARGGVRENSGRKSARAERLISDVVNKCWDRISRNLNSKRLSEAEKDMIALEIVKRTAPSKLDIKGTLAIKGNQISLKHYGEDSKTGSE